MKNLAQKLADAKVDFMQAFVASNDWSNILQRLSTKVEFHKIQNDFVWEAIKDGAIVRFETREEAKKECPEAYEVLRYYRQTDLDNLKFFNDSIEDAAKEMALLKWFESRYNELPGRVINQTLEHLRHKSELSQEYFDELNEKLYYAREILGN